MHLFVCLSLCPSTCLFCLSGETALSKLSLLFRRRVNVTRFGDKPQCFAPVSPQKYYIVFAEIRANLLVAKYDELFGAAADWTQQSEERVWSAVGKFWTLFILHVGLMGTVREGDLDPGLTRVTGISHRFIFHDKMIKWQFYSVLIRIVSLRRQVYLKCISWPLPSDDEKLDSKRRKFPEMLK